MVDAGNVARVLGFTSAEEMESHKQLVMRTDRVAVAAVAPCSSLMSSEENVVVSCLYGN